MSVYFFRGINTSFLPFCDWFLCGPELSSGRSGKGKIIFSHTLQVSTSDQAINSLAQGSIEFLLAIKIKSKIFQICGTLHNINSSK